jgi:cobalamin biosynthesis protein CobD/CbiB
MNRIRSCLNVVPARCYAWAMVIAATPVGKAPPGYQSFAAAYSRRSVKGPTF